jgi:hypothetical protein
MEEPRSGKQRKHDSLTRLEHDVDVWVATSDGAGEPYLVPLSFLWDGSALVLSTPESSITGRNLRSSRGVRLALGHTRDVVLIEGGVESFTLDTVPTALADAFASKLWDSRLEPNRYAFFRITPEKIQAWREVNELKGRDLMRDGVWLY